MPSLKTTSFHWHQRSSIWLVRGYQVLRPFLDRILFSVFGVVSECKHTPTCSEYMILQIRSRGTIAGVGMGLLRILSCR